MQIEFAAPTLPDGGTLVVLAAAGNALGPETEALDRRTGGLIRRALALAGDRFKRKSMLELVAPEGAGPERLLVAGLGKADELKVADLEALGGAIAVRLRGLGVERAAVLVDPIGGLPLAASGLAVALATGAALRSYRFMRYRTKPEENDATELEALTLLLEEHAEAEDLYGPEAAVLEGVRHARDLVSEPANVLSPEAFAEACRALGAEVGLEVEILGRPQLQELGMNALLGVSQGSVREPFVAVMRWSGGAGGDAPVALVGKGVCFDSGGLSLKPPGGMEDMKWDMGGAAAVFGAKKAIAGRHAKANVVGVLGLVENMPSGSAQRPGDVVRTMSGVTVEVVNTDAEGRLVLADLLHYTADRFKPKAMVDLATLTGAIIIALGHEQAGLFTDDDELGARLQAAGEATGEKLWRMPLGEPYAEHIKSDIADIKNVGRSREAGATAGAIFLKRFVGEVPWAHLDIAGVTFSKRDLALAQKGATGFGVRLLDRWLREHHG